MANDDANEVKSADSEHKRELWDRLESLRTMMLTTHDAEGRRDEDARLARPVVDEKGEARAGRVDLGQRARDCNQPALARLTDLGSREGYGRRQ